MKSFYEWGVDIFTIFVGWVVSVVGKLGYPGIIIMMGLESSFIPFPSEVVIPPAGYLTVQGDMNIILVIICGTVGSLLGASLTYWLAIRFGRKLLIRYSKYLFLTEARINYMDDYFRKHGEITTFIGRLVPVVRWYISFPAGLSRMHFGKFLFYTGFGALIWVVILAFIGRAVGNNIELVKEYLHNVAIVTVPLMVALVVAYILLKRYMKKKIEGGYD